MTMTITPVILSGGSGSRLWPLSREGHPKQFWPMLASRYSLLQETALRGDGQYLGSEKLSFSPLLLVCNQQHRFKVAEQLRETGVEQARIILEPEGRNSAPAIAVASLLVAEEDPDSILWVMPADAAITQPESVGPALEKAVEAAKSGYIAVFGMQPMRAETGYGYIEKGTLLNHIPGVYEVSSFVEKPDVGHAEHMWKSGKYLWNSGMFIFRAQVMLEEMERHAPDVLAAARQAVALRKNDLDFVRLDETHFRQAPDISIDYAIAEKTGHMAVISASFGWSDVGSWEALWEIGAKDSGGNVTSGDVLLHGAKQCYIRSEGLLAAIGPVEDIVVVATKDVVLVTHRNDTQGVRQIVERLKAKNRPEAVIHHYTYRPWGAYESLIQGDRFQVKRIIVKPGQKLSLQKHFHRAEHWIVVEGTALVTRDDKENMVRENESIYLPLGCVHRLENPGKIPLTLIEVQSGPYLGEDDIIRLDDVYSRS